MAHYFHIEEILKLGLVEQEFSEGVFLFIST